MKTKHGHVPSVILLVLVFFFAPGCSSLPSIPNAEIPAELPAEAVSPPGEPADLTDIEDLLFPETEITEIDEELERVGTDGDNPEIWIRAEETLAYLDTPVTPDLPEPEYVIPEPEPSIAEAEPLPVIEPEAEIVEEIGDDAFGPAEDAEEVAVEEPPPAPPPLPVILRPVEEVTAAPPSRKPLPVPPSPLPMQPTRVPPNETTRKDDITPPTRTIQAMLGENTEVDLPGSGWVYLGEANNQSGLAYRQRRASADGQVFVFRPENAGSYRLKFTKQDLLRGTETSEIVEVVIAEKNMPEELVANLAIATADTLVDTGALPAETPPEPPILDDDTTSFTALATAVTDAAALWNRGQALEVPGPNRDIKAALTAYKTLVRDYPQSEYYTGSQKRIAYIERYFVNIR
jgi:hypothetical protein